MTLGYDYLSSFGRIMLSSRPDRELITEGWSLLIDKATGERPIVQHLDDKNKIVWRAGQAKKMEQYLSGLMKPGKQITAVPGAPGAFDLSQVEVDMKPVLTPLIIKKVLPYLAVYSIALFYLAKKI